MELREAVRITSKVPAPATVRMPSSAQCKVQDGVSLHTHELVGVRAVGVGCGPVGAWASQRGAVGVVTCTVSVVCGPVGVWCHVRQARRADPSVLSHAYMHALCGLSVLY